MKVELNKLAVHNRLSEETTCFTALVYVDGKKTASVVNEGRGGSHGYVVFDKERFSALTDYASAQPPFLHDGVELPMDLDFYLELLVQRRIAEKELKSGFRKGFVFTTKANPSQPWQVRFTSEGYEEDKAKLLRSYPDAIIYNDLPFEEAVDLRLKWEGGY